MAARLEQTGVGHGGNGAGAVRASLSLGGRALVGVALLGGFYVLAAGVLVGLYGLNAVVFSATGRVYSTLVAFSLVTAAAVVSGVWVVAGRRSDEVDGVAVTRLDQPRLWSMLEQVAGRMGTTPPGELWIVDDVNAWVSESGGMLGLRRGRRRMGVGLALLQVLDADGLRAVIAHELGHYAGGDSRLGPLHHRAAASLRQTVTKLGADTLLGRVFAAYARVYWRVSLAVRRRQELNADAAAVALGGRDSLTRALTALEPAASAYAALLDRYVAPVWQRGQRPDNLYDGFARMWGDAGCQRQLAAVVDRALAAEPHPLDSHPSLAQRLAHARTLDEVDRPHDATPARALLRDPDGLERRMTRHLSERAGAAGTAGLSWDDVAEGVFRPAMLDRAHAFLDEVARVDRRPSPAGTARLLDVVGGDGVVALAANVAGALEGVPARERGEYQAAVVTAEVRTTLGCALVESTGASWRLSWSGPLEVVARDGRPLDVDGWAQVALDQPERLPDVRGWLAEEGVAPDWTPPSPHGGPQRAPQELWWVLHDVQHRGKPADALLLTDELLIARARSTPWERAVAAVAASAGMRRGRATGARLDRLLARPLDAIAAGDPRNRRVAWTQIRHARLRRGLLGGWRLQLSVIGEDDVKLTANAHAPERKAVGEALRAVLGDRLDG